MAMQAPSWEKQELQRPMKCSFAQRRVRSGLGGWFGLGEGRLCLVED